ncbi:MAG: endonuclease/exonuclease/phosphatase family protein [Gemmobacter sp.]
MRIAAFNVENLFDRARIMNLDTWEDGRPVLEAFAEFTDLLERDVYDAPTQARLADLLVTLGLAKDDMGPFVILRRNRGGLLTRRKDGTIVIKAKGRGDWIGWAELRNAPVNETAILNTARVIADVGADILAVVEAEDRVALRAFSEDLLPRVGGVPYPHIMLIDGNDRRGIDVGLMTRAGFQIGLMRSHVHHGLPGRTTFGRDCPEYQVTTPAGEVIWVLPCHFKSKGYGNPRDNDARRKREAAAAAGFVTRLLAEGAQNVVVLGDLNDTPGSDPLSPLFGHPALHDVGTVAGFDTAGHPGRGTRKLGNDSDQIDHILVSDALWPRVTGAGLFRKGAWAGSRPRRWQIYDTITSEIHAASDHHAIWVDIA